MLQISNWSRVAMLFLMICMSFTGTNLSVNVTWTLLYVKCVGTTVMRKLVLHFYINSTYSHFNFWWVHVIGLFSVSISYRLLEALWFDVVLDHQLCKREVGHLELKQRGGWKRRNKGMNGAPESWVKCGSSIPKTLNPLFWWCNPKRCTCAEKLIIGWNIRNLCG